MERVTQKQIEWLAGRINLVTGSPSTPYSKTDGKYRANIGCFYIDGAYGGVELVRIDNEHGGVETISTGGHVPKRELATQMRAILKGLELAK